MKLINVNTDNTLLVLEEAVATLKRGGLVVYPTETCYGLGADATNQVAVDALLGYKRRREGKPLSILVPDKKTALNYVDLNESANKLYDRFLPGPVTVISRSTNKLARGVASELGTVGVRISSHPFAMALSQAYGKPITATSANASWKKKPYTINDILETLTEKQKERLDLIIDAGSLPKREASTVIDTTLVGGMILRQGDINLQAATTFDSDSEEETKKIAQTLMLKSWDRIRKHGLLVALIGDLGMGKTVFAKGVGRFLHIPDTIISPSYTLVNEYEYQRYGVKGMLYHLDPWRLDSFEHIEKLGLSDMLTKNNVVLIEWANKFLPNLQSLTAEKKVALTVIGFASKGENKRTLTVEAAA